MALLRSVNNVPGVDQYDYRDVLYYNKYEYRIRLNVPCARYICWCKDPTDLDLKLNGKSKSYGNVRKQDIKKVTDNLLALKSLIEISNECKKTKNYTVRVESNTIAIFASDLKLLETLSNRVGLSYKIDCTQAITSGFSGIKYFEKEPKHKFRIYLKSKHVPESLHPELKKTLGMQTKLYPSAALKQWLNRTTKVFGSWHFRWTSAAHFIDYDEESTLSYLALMHGDILGKKYKLEKRPITT